MVKILQLHIPSPCHEDWTKMTPSDKGRHCAACQKTVVDFTGMSDSEIIRHMTQARSGVCGRLAQDQLHRNLVPMQPIQRNGVKGWQWLLAGILFTADGSLPDRRSSIVGMVVNEPQLQKVDTVREGDIFGVISPEPGKTEVKSIDTVIEGRVDTIGEVMGDIALAGVDSAAGLEGPPVDTTVIRGRHLRVILLMILYLWEG